MKRSIKTIGRAFLFVMLALSVAVPRHAEATPLTVTIHGQLSYEPRNFATLGIMLAGVEMQIDLYELDHTGAEHLLSTTYTNTNGIFSFTVTNYWGPSDPHLNVFYRVRLNYSSTLVYNPNPQPPNDHFYHFDSGTTLLNSDTITDWPKNFAIDHTKQNFQAVWIFEDMRNAWDFVNTYDIRNGVHYDPGEVTAYWTSGNDCYTGICSSFTTPNFIFISNSNILSMDVVVHETGHKFMAYAGWWYPWPDCWTHYIFGISDQQCAYSEGWADFMAMAVNRDPCYNFTPNPCGGIIDQQYYNLEIHSRTDNQSQFPGGDSVEGRVAAALYDLYDYQNEGFDSISAGFAPISQLALGNVHPFIQFWYSWNLTSGQDYLNSGLTFWWNTINYANIQQVFMPVLKK